MSPAFNRENDIITWSFQLQHQGRNDTFQYGLVRKGPWTPLYHSEDRKLQIIIVCMHARA